LRASTPEQQAFIGNQAGGRVFLFLAADDFENIVRDVRASRLGSGGAALSKAPRHLLADG